MRFVVWKRSLHRHTHLPSGASTSYIPPRHTMKSPYSGVCGKTCCVMRKSRLWVRMMAPWSSGAVKTLAPTVARTL